MTIEFNTQRRQFIMVGLLGSATLIVPHSSLASREVKIEGYDGFRFLTRNDVSKYFSYAFSVRTGTRNTSVFSNLTFQAELTFDVAGWLVSLMYFDRYGKNISTYHLKDKYWGIGLKMW